MTYVERVHGKGTCIHMACCRIDTVQWSVKFQLEITMFPLLNVMSISLANRAFILSYSEG